MSFLIFRILNEVLGVNKNSNENSGFPINPVSFEKDNFEHIELIEAMASLYASTFDYSSVVSD